MKNFNWLSNRAIISLSGSDCYNFLQKLITNDILKVNDNTSIYSCLLTPQGKYYTDFFITKNDESLFLDIPANQKEFIIKKLLLYKLRSNILIQDISSEYNIFSIFDDNIFQYQEITEGANVKFNHGLAFIDPRDQKLGIRAYIPIKNINLLEKEYSQDQYFYDQIRINLRIPEGEKDLIQDKSFPLEYNLHNLNAISFTKGCYIGQELVSRTYHRGVIRKKIYSIESLDKDLPEITTEIYAGNVKIGNMASKFNNIGLALIRIDDFEANKEQEIYAGQTLVRIL
jgi:folate-binding protein YgfZ